MKLKYHTYITGLTRSGKTTTGFNYLRLQKHSIRIYFNTKLESKWKQQSKYVLNSDNYKIFLKAVYDNPKDFSDGIICINPDINLGKKGIVPILKYIINRHLKKQSLKTTLLIDEIHVFQSGRSLDEWIERLYVMGLGLGITMMSVAQRPQQIHQTIRQNSETVILHFTKPFDIDYLQKNGEIDFDPKFPSKYTAYMQPSAMQGWKKINWNKGKNDNIPPELQKILEMIG